MASVRPATAAVARTPLSRAQRILAFMTAGVVLVSVLCFVAVIIGSIAGMSSESFGGGAWPVVTIFPLIGLPAGMFLVIVLLVVTAVSRSRAARDARH